jgi:TetR/AcrR family transcriptional regulator, regulator of autoinduction and epiphytic fitness
MAMPLPQCFGHGLGRLPAAPAAGVATWPAAPTIGQMTTVLSADDQPVDGRLRRGARTRDAIVRSYIELLGSGDRAPRAEKIAQRAGVGIRTVYNQFRDMESLRAEAGALVWAQIEKYIVRDVPSGASLDERIDLFVDMRSQLLETLAPYARSAQGHHATSGELRRQRTVLVTGSKRELSVTFRPELSRRDGSERDQFLDALHAVSGSSAWSGLRDELNLEVGDATAVFRLTLRALLNS